MKTDFNINSIVLTNDEFKTEDELKKALADLLLVLTKAGYICTFRQDEYGIYVIEFDYDEHMKFGNPQPHWIIEDEWLDVLYNRDHNSEDTSENTETEEYNYQR